MTDPAEDFLVKFRKAQTRVSPRGREEHSREHEKPAGITATPFRWIHPFSIPPRKYLFGRHAIRQFLSSTVAPGGVGKTSNALAEGISFVCGRDLLNNHLMT